MAFLGGRKGNENPVTAPTDEDSLILENREPWRCRACGLLIHNTDNSGYPAPGAPVPKYAGTEYPTVCTTCFDMYIAISSRSYWTVLHEAWKKAWDKLKDGGDYFAK